MLRLYGLRPDEPRWLQGAAKALAYLATIRAGRPMVEADHWALLATDDFLRVYDRLEQPLHRRAYVEHGAQICRSILAERSTLDRRFTPVGCFSADGRTCPTATRIEGFLAAQSFLAETDATLLRRVQSATESGILFLLAAQKRSGRHAGGIPRAIARLPEGHPLYTAHFNERATEIRIDQSSQTVGQAFNVSFRKPCAPPRPVALAAGYTRRSPNRAGFMSRSAHVPQRQSLHPYGWTGWGPLANMRHHGREGHPSRCEGGAR